MHSQKVSTEQWKQLNRAIIRILSIILSIIEEVSDAEHQSVKPGRTAALPVCSWIWRLIASPWTCFPWEISYQHGLILFFQCSLKLILARELTTLRWRVRTPRTTWCLRVRFLLDCNRPAANGGPRWVWLQRWIITSAKQSAAKAELECGSTLLCVVATLTPSVQTLLGM